MSTSDAFTTIFFFNDTATTEIYTLSLLDALPISSHPLSDVCFANIQSQLLCCLCIESMVSLTGQKRLHLRWSRLFLVSFAALAQSDRLLPNRRLRLMAKSPLPRSSPTSFTVRSEEHTSELQSRQYL